MSITTISSPIIGGVIKHLKQPSEFVFYVISFNWIITNSSTSYLSTENYHHLLTFQREPENLRVAVGNWLKQNIRSAKLVYLPRIISNYVFSTEDCNLYQYDWWTRNLKEAIETKYQDVDVDVDGKINWLRSFDTLYQIDNFEIEIIILMIEQYLSPEEVYQLIFRDYCESNEGCWATLTKTPVEIVDSKN